MHFKKTEKGMSQAMWIVIALVIALIVALLLILIFSSSSDKAGKQGTGAIDNSGKGANAEICQARCDTCKRLGTACDQDAYTTDCPNVACAW